jgi:hypothetical protein
MCSLNGTTPQLKAVETLIDGYCSLDMKNIEPHISKDFMFRSFPEAPNLPVGPKEQYLERFQPVISLMKKLEVSNRREGATFPLMLTTATPSTLFTK